MLERIADGRTDLVFEYVTEGHPATAVDDDGAPLSWASWHLRPDSILRMLCYAGMTSHPNRRSTFDHGVGWGELDASLLGTPHGA